MTRSNRYHHFVTLLSTNADSERLKETELRRFGVFSWVAGTCRCGSQARSKGPPCDNTCTPHPADRKDHKITVQGNCLLLSIPRFKPDMSRLAALKNSGSEILKSVAFDISGVPSCLQVLQTASWNSKLCPFHLVDLICVQVNLTRGGGLLNSTS
jgi:hypothetical protein